MSRKMLFREGSGVTLTLSEVEAADEAELHRLVLDHPELIPVEDLELTGPLLVVGKECFLPSGKIDLLCMARGGAIVIVEFKTGPQNPDFRRVLAQLIDYGSHLWGLTFEAFDLLTRARLSSPLLKAMEVHWGEDFAAEADDVRSKIVEQLQSGRFMYVAAAQRFTDVMMRSVQYLNQATTSNFFGIELIKFEDGERIAYESRSVVLPRRVAGPSPPGSIISEAEFLDRFDSGSAREAMRLLVDWLRATDFRLEFVSAGFSMRVKTQLRAEPISVGWIFPPGVPRGYRTFKDVTLGFEQKHIARFEQTRPVFDRYVAALEQLPRAERTVTANSDVVHFPSDVIEPGLIERLKPILADVHGDLSLLTR